MTYTPKSKNASATVFFIGFMLIAAVFLCLGGTVPVYPLIFQLFAVVFAGFGIHIYIRHGTYSYRYEASQTDLNIYRISGKKTVCLCSLNYEESISGILDAAEEAEKKAKLPATQMALNYCKTFYFKAYSVYYFHFNGKICRLKFEPDKAFSAYVNKQILLANSRKNPSQNQTEDEE